VASLADYGVLPADLAELNVLIDAFVNLIPAPRIAITARKGATTGLATFIKDADSVLKERLDKLMQLFKVSALEFYTHYFNARIIVGNKGGNASDPGTGKAAVSGKVTEMGTGNALENVEVTLNPVGTSVFTVSDGSYSIAAIEPGNYDLQFQLVGYDTQLQPVSLSEDEVKLLDVEMKVGV